MIAGVAMTLVLVPRMVRQRRSASSTTAWLMVILLIPWLGIPAYLVFGGRKLSVALMLKPPLGSARSAEVPPPGQAGADQLLQSYGLPRAQFGNRFSLCADGVDIYNRFIETIESAEKHIHMASFIRIRTRLASP
jgi:cardiolipin synthase